MNRMEQPNYWMPNEVEVFGQEIEKDLNPEAIKEITSFWVEQFNENKLDLWSFQERLSGQLIRALACYNRKEPAVAQQHIEAMDRFYHELFEREDSKVFFQDSNLRRASWNYGIFRAGFTAEYAVAKAMSQSSKLDVFYPSQRDNHALKVDWWLAHFNPETTLFKGLGVQVKNAGRRIEKVNFIHPDSDAKEEIKTKVESIYSSVSSQKNGNYQPLEQSLKLLRNIETFKIKMQRYENVSPLVLLVPSNAFDSKTGTPSEDFTSDVTEHLDSIFAQ